MPLLEGTLLIDAVCLILTGLWVILLHYLGMPFERGMFCNDETISYPYKNNTISENTIILIGIGGPFIVFIIVEGIRARTRPLISKKCWQGRDEEMDPPNTNITIWRRDCFLKTMLHVYTTYLMGLGITWSFVEVGKMSTGRLRPHFLSVCQPLEVNICFSGATNYINKITCQGDPREVRQARLSFPSGHSTLSFFYAIFLCLYLERRRVWRSARLMRPFAQICLMVSAWYISLTRISDYWHHWSDVLVGIVIGSTFSIIVFYFLFLKYDTVPSSSEVVSETTQLLVVKTQPSDNSSTSNNSYPTTR